MFVLYFLYTFVSHFCRFLTSITNIQIFTLFFLQCTLIICQCFSVTDSCRSYGVSLPEFGVNCKLQITRAIARPFAKTIRSNKVTESREFSIQLSYVTLLFRRSSAFHAALRCGGKFLWEKSPHRRPNEQVRYRTARRSKAERRRDGEKKRSKERCREIR